MEFYTHKDEEIVPVVVLNKYTNTKDGKEYCVCIDVSYCCFDEDIAKQVSPFEVPIEDVLDTPQEAFDKFLSHVREKQNDFCEHLKEVFYDKYPISVEVSEMPTEDSSGQKGKSYIASHDPLTETRDRRVQLVLRPSLVSVLKRIASHRKQSLNNLVEEVLTEFLEHEKQLLQEGN